jgi:hypothetical protein
MNRFGAFVAAAVLGWGAANFASAKLPGLSEEQKAKAAEAKAKADDAARKEAELLGKYQDRAADNFRRAKVMKTGSAAPQAVSGKR